MGRSDLERGSAAAWGMEAACTADWRLEDSSADLSTDLDGRPAEPPCSLDDMLGSTSISAELLMGLNPPACTSRCSRCTLQVVTGWKDSEAHTQQVKKGKCCCSTTGLSVHTAAELRSPARGPAAPQGAPPAQRCAAAAPGHARPCRCGRGGPPAAAGRGRSPQPHCPAPARPRCSKACSCAMCWNLLPQEASTAAAGNTCTALPCLWALARFRGRCR